MVSWRSCTNQAWIFYNVNCLGLLYKVAEYLLLRPQKETGTVHISKSYLYLYFNDTFDFDREGTLKILTSNYTSFTIVSKDLSKISNLM